MSFGSSRGSIDVARMLPSVTSFTVPTVKRGNPTVNGATPTALGSTSSLSAYLRIIVFVPDRPGTGSTAPIAAPGIPGVHRSPSGGI